MWQLARLRPRPVRQGQDLPIVSVIISAYNEAKVIEAKLANTLELDYPREKLQIMVLSDGSTDATPNLVAGFRPRGVEGRHSQSRRGKTAALNDAVPGARGEIILFSDANTMYNAQAVRSLVRNFSDPTVGAVSGVKSILAQEDRPGSRGEGLYWRFESWLKEQESRVGSIATGDGEIFALRRSLFRPQAESTIHDDLALSLEVLRQGHRVVYEPEARSFEPASRSLIDEFRIKMRMAAGGLQIVQRFWRGLLPPRDLFTWEFFSHKILRWVLGILLVLVLISSALLDGLFFRWAFGLQMCFYAAAGAGLALWKWKGTAGPFYLPFYFCLVNAACLTGVLQFVAGKHSASWKKAER
jgi:cellulose synthase/poly-beta-1,6-N-acetylglucosamine synthase-like glycosyltransferase